MKHFTKLLSVFLVLLLLATCLIACGGKTEETETETQIETENETVDSVKRDEYGREWIDDSIPADLSYATADKNTVTFFVRMGGEGATEIEMDSDAIIEDTVNDAIYFRNTTVEERLGVVITRIAQECVYTDVTPWMQTLRNAVNTNSGDFDGAAIYASQGSPLALEGCYYNVLSMDTLDLAKPWWNRDMISELELFDTLYFLGGDLMITQTQQAGAMLYNKTLFEKYYPDVDIYSLVTDYQWTIDKLYELSSTVWEDTNTSGMIDDGDTVGYTGFGSGHGYNDIWQAAVGVRIITKNSDGIPELSLYSEHAINAFEKLAKLHLENPGCMATGGSTTNTTFNLENVLFSITALYNCESLRDMTSPYGALPLPMFDEDQGYYATYPHNGCSLLTVLSSIEAERVDMIGHTIELMAAESYRQVMPKYFEVCLKSKYSADASDAMMFDIIVESIRFDYGLVFGTKSIGGVNILFRDYSADFAQKYESNRTTYETALEKLIDKLDELSFNMGA